MADKRVTTLTYKKDPLSDLKATMGGQRGFKGASVPSNPFKDAKPRVAIDAFYTPHKGGEKT